MSATSYFQASFYYTSCWGLTWCLHQEIRISPFFLFSLFSLPVPNSFPLLPSEMMPITLFTLHFVSSNLLQVDLNTWSELSTNSGFLKIQMKTTCYRIIWELVKIQIPKPHLTRKFLPGIIPFVGREDDFGCRFPKTNFLSHYGCCRMTSLIALIDEARMEGCQQVSFVFVCVW